MKERRYCWRVGIALDLAAMDVCVECGQTGASHRVLAKNECGHFAPCM